MSSLTYDEIAEVVRAMADPVRREAILRAARASSSLALQARSTGATFRSADQAAVTAIFRRTITPTATAEASQSTSWSSSSSSSGSSVGSSSGSSSSDTFGSMDSWYNSQATSTVASSLDEPKAITKIKPSPKATAPPVAKLTFGPASGGDISRLFAPRLTAPASTTRESISRPPAPKATDAEPEIIEDSQETAEVVATAGPAGGKAPSSPVKRRASRSPARPDARSQDRRQGDKDDKDKDKGDKDEGGDRKGEKGDSGTSSRPAK